MNEFLVLAFAFVAMLCAGGVFYFAARRLDDHLEKQGPSRSRPSTVTSNSDGG